MIVMYSHATTLWNFLAEQSRNDQTGHTSGFGQRSNIDLSVRLGIAQGIASGMSMLHSNGVVHLDLKSQNVLMEGQKPMIADMGTAQTEVQLQGGYYTPGSGPWMAPEILRGVLKLPADVYSFGVILWELLSQENLQHGWEQGHPKYPKQPPFFSEDGPVWAKSGFRPKVSSHSETHCCKWVRLIRDCWELAPGDRPTFEAIRQRCGQPERPDSGELETKDVIIERPPLDRGRSELELSALVGSAAAEPEPEGGDEGGVGTPSYMRESLTPVMAWFQEAGLSQYGIAAAQDEAYCQYGLDHEEGVDALEVLLSEDGGFAACVRALGVSDADAERLRAVVDERAAARAQQQQQAD